MRWLRYLLWVLVLLTAGPLLALVGFVTLGLALGLRGNDDPALGFGVLLIPFLPVLVLVPVLPGAALLAVTSRDGSTWGRRVSLALGVVAVLPAAVVLLACGVALIR